VRRIARRTRIRSRAPQSPIASKRLAERHDREDHLDVAEPGQDLRLLALDERFRPMRFPGALPEVGVDDLLQVVDVVAVSHDWASANASFTWPRICGSDHHRVEAGGDAKHVADGGPRLSGTSATA
jgi:hypothetical protein